MFTHAVATQIEDPLGHVFRWLVVLSAVIIGALWLAHRLSETLIRRHGRRFGFDRLSDVASFPLILLLFNWLQQRRTVRSPSAATGVAR